MERLLAGRRPTWAEVDLDRLAGNFARIRNRIGAERRILAVVKADAYGHGAVETGPCLEAAGADLLAVALPEEGIELRAAGVRCDILLLGPLAPDQIEPIFEFRLTPTVAEWPMLDRLEAAAARRPTRQAFHLKIDTGMGRLGVAPDSLAAGIEQLRRLRACRLTGVFSHLACAEDPADPHTAWQRGQFTAALDQLRAGGIDPGLVHLANSAAVLDHPDCLFDAVRPGLLLYGCHPATGNRRMEIEPVLQFRTRVVALKEVPAGTPVGYGRTFRTTRRSRIATLPVGYHDGLPRIHPPRGEVLVRGRRAPIAGVLSMDLTTIDVTDIDGVERGDPVTLLGRDGTVEIRAEEVAGSARMIPYEILCGIGNRVPRLYHRTGLPVSLQGRHPTPALGRSPVDRETEPPVS